MTKGFVTIATGQDKYYKTAVNLLKSYKLFTNTPLPFAIICDRENEYTEKFDKVIILDSPYRTYLDKIQLLNHIPYDETIFVEADCLAYADLNLYFDAFNGCDDFAAFGRSLPLDSTEDCWFKIEETGKYKDKINFRQRFHSGVIFLRKGDICQKMYDICIDVEKNYDLYNIGDSRESLDDKLFAISSAVMQCKMRNLSPVGYENYCIPPNASPKMRKKRCTYINYLNKRTKTVICHFGSDNTERIPYKREVASLNYLTDKKFSWKVKEILLTILYPFSELKRIIKDTFWKIVLWKPIKACLMPFKKLSRK